ncbi:MAG: transcription elongation factor GreB [Pseudomonas sp.]|jgi:transcription elongation factor GreB|nr:transcription elongation factor GreB [Pseudomonas sp.]MDY0415619.1 transcription elongation factor GreB [Pseudomonas sp.]NLO53252.1 transcription elongation factor GreB [Gammaproteobacteria bacterium]
MIRKLLTAEGYKKLKDELEYLHRKLRPEITEIVSWAASLGDRSENADYQYNKRKLREIDRRIRHLTKLFEVAECIEYNPAQEGKVYFGAWCELENDDGESMRFRIVGDEEVYGRKDYISLRSPMAKACLGKTQDEDISVRTPSGDRHWYIVKIEYNCASDLEGSAE